MVKAQQTQQSSALFPKMQAGAPLLGGGSVCWGSSKQLLPSVRLRPMPLARLGAQTVAEAQGCKACASLSFEGCRNSLHCQEPDATPIDAKTPPWRSLGLGASEFGHGGSSNFWPGGRTNCLLHPYDGAPLLNTRHHRDLQEFQMAIMGDLHLAPEQMHLFHDARDHFLQAFSQLESTGSSRPGAGTGLGAV
jgi:hypothetical protein